MDPWGLQVLALTWEINFLQPHANAEPHVGYTQVTSSQILTKNSLGWKSRPPLVFQRVFKAVGSWGSESCAAYPSGNYSELPGGTLW